MYASEHRSARSGSSRGPAMYYGFCQRSREYRMMDLPEYMSNVQEGITRLVNDSASAYEGMVRNYPGAAAGAAAGTATLSRKRTRDCGCKGGCNDCHCDCCVCDADVLLHGRCGELRRIPLTFENDTRRDRPVTLELGKFVTSGGRDLGWTAQLSETQFTLRPCDEHTVILTVQIRCERDDRTAQPADAPASVARPAATATNPNERFGRVDSCEVGYATVRAEGCLTRPVIVAVAVLPDDCDAYQHPCGCDCCH